MIPTPLNAETRKSMVAQAAAAAASPLQQADRSPLRWRGKDQSWDVAQLLVEIVLLNPNSHRIKAQIKSLGEKGQEILDDPFTEKSQNSIEDIIRATKGYSKIKAAIARDKQEEPGVITHEGLLVNANTRAVALRDLYAEASHNDRKAFEYIKVHILPPDALDEELVQLELAFQMRPEVRQPYTFTNQLLFIQDLLAAGMSPEQIGLDMDRSYNPDDPKHRAAAAKDVMLSDRLRQMVQELIEASGSTRTWGHFDDERQNLLEIDNTYQQMLGKNGDAAARRVRQAKYAAMLAGLDYRKIRSIDDSYIDEYLVPALEEEPDLAQSAQALAMGPAVQDEDSEPELDFLDGLDSFGATDTDTVDSTSETVTLDPLFELLVKSGSVTEGQDPTVELPTNDGIAVVPRKTFMDSVRSAMIVAVNQKERDDQSVDALDVPRKQVIAAANACDKARSKLDELFKTDRVVDQNKLRVAFEAYQRSHDELTAYLSDRFGFDVEEVSSP